MNNNKIIHEVLCAAVSMILTPISYFPFRYIFRVYWAFQDPPGIAVNRDAIDQAFHNFVWSFGTTLFDLSIYGMIAISLFYISIPVLFFLNLLGELVISRIEPKWKLHLLLSWLISGFSYALFWYFFFYNSVNPIYAF